MPRSDEQCVRPCLDGRAEAFRLLVERYQSPLIRCLRMRLGNVGEAEEVSQEAFVRAYFALAKLKRPAAFFPWLYGIADRVVKESLHAAKRCRTVDCARVECVAPADSREPGPASLVAQAVANLPDAYREVVVLRFYAGQSCLEISHNLGVPLGTVTKRLSRAYGLLREHLRGTIPDTGDEVPR